MFKKYAAIDIGSYNCRLVIVEKNNSNFYKIVEKFSMETNLIKDLSYNNEFTPKKISKTIKCLKEISKKITQHGITKYRCVATEACRQVINPEFFTENVMQQTGLNVEIISSYEEARLSLKSCEPYMKRFKKNGLLFDIGGGSTELTFFNLKKKNIITKSISLGVVNLSEKSDIFGDNYVKDMMVKHFIKFKNSLSDFTFDNLSLGSCSTVTTLCAMHLNLSSYQANKIEGYEIDAKEIFKASNFFNNLSDNERSKHPCIGKRYNLLKNGIKILEKILDIFLINKVIATHKGLRDGMINELV